MMKERIIDHIGSTLSTPLQKGFSGLGWTTGGLSRATCHRTRFKMASEPGFQQPFIGISFTSTNSLKTSLGDGTRADRRVTFTKPTKRCRRHHRTTIQMLAKYISSTSLDVNFSQRFRSGSFGAVFLGRYNGANSELSDEIDEVVVKCPIDSEIGRKLYEMERHTNMKLTTKFSTAYRRFPNLVGEIIIPPTMPLSPGLARVGLVWQRSGSGATLEDYLSTSNIDQLAATLGTIPVATPLRRQLSATILRELAYIVQDLQTCGIVHRDIKPDNLLINDGEIQVIDFGSSCDWNTITKKGLRLATCDPIYAAPEKRLNVFQPPFSFDVYSIALIALRAGLPSITDVTAFNEFVSNVLQKRGRSSIEKVCSGVENGRITVSPALRADLTALSGPGNEDMYGTLATMLTQEPGERAKVSDCLRTRFVQNSGY